MKDGNQTDPLIKITFRDIYSPSDDSYLILDHFEGAITETSFDGIKISEITNILDMGTGSGIISIYLALLRNRIQTFTPEIFASDILGEAIECAKKNEKMNKISPPIHFIQSNLFQNFPQKLQGKFEIIIFNPPYLPSSKEINCGKNKHKIDYSWDGGPTGNEILISFLENMKMYLNWKKSNLIYFVTSSNADLDGLSTTIKKLGYKNEIISRIHVFFEDVFLNRIKLEK